MKTYKPRVRRVKSPAKQVAGLKATTWRDVITLTCFGLVLALLGWHFQHPTTAPLFSPAKLVKVQAQEVAPTPHESTWDDIKLACVKIGRKYHAPPAIMMSVMAIESARGTSELCTKRNNCFGMGAYDSNPDAAFEYETKEQGCESYAKFITGQAVESMYPSPLIRNAYRYAATLYDKPEEMAQAIKDALYATDPDYVATIINTPEFHEYNY